MENDLTGKGSESIFASLRNTRATYDGEVGTVRLTVADSNDVNVAFDFSQKVTS